MSAKQNDERIAQENLLLKAKILLKDGHLDQFEDIDPAIENEFLKNVLAFEAAPERRVFQILDIDPTDYPPAKKLNDAELQKKFKHLVDLLAKNGFIFSLAEELPARIAYTYLAEEFLFAPTPILPGWQFHIDGCDGDCPSCFQADFCKSKDDIWPPDELKAEREKRQKESN